MTGLLRIFRERLLVSVCSSFPFGFEGGMRDLIELVPDHCLSIYSEAGLMMVTARQPSKLFHKHVLQLMCLSYHINPIKRPGSVAFNEMIRYV